MAESGFEKVAEIGDLSPGEMKSVMLGQEEVLLANVNGNFYAISDTCTHVGGPLSEGSMDGNIVTCPWHGATFDVTSGSTLGGPAPSGVSCFTVRVTGDDIELEI